MPPLTRRSRASGSGADEAAASSPNGYRVLVRVRPPLGLDGAAPGQPNVVEILGPSRLRVLRPDLEPVDLQVDRALGPSAGQGDVFENLQDLVGGVVDGLCGTVLAYGQTGSGKTHTMIGGLPGHTQESSLRVGQQADQRGLIPRSLEYLFGKIAPQLSSKSGEPGQLHIYVSFMEIYSERVFDLLTGSRPERTANSGVASSPAGRRESSRRTAGGLDVLEGRDGTVSVPGLTVVEIRSLEQALEIMKIGIASRATGDNGLNPTSSRSHAIFQLLLERPAQRRRSDPQNHNATSQAKLNFVDLAGSEKLQPDGSTVSGPLLQELTCINLSLSALGQCISALVDSRRTHVPYRDSKLTRLLQDSLRGRSLTAMCVCVSPALVSLEETLSSLKFADRAKRAVLDPHPSHHPGGGTPHRQVEELFARVEELTEQLRGEREARLRLEGILERASNTSGASGDVPRLLAELDQVEARGGSGEGDIRASMCIEDGDRGGSPSCECRAPEMGGDETGEENIADEPIRSAGSGQMDEYVVGVSACLQRLSLQNDELRKRLEALEGRPVPANPLSGSPPTSSRMLPDRVSGPGTRGCRGSSASVSRSPPPELLPSDSTLLEGTVLGHEPPGRQRPPAAPAWPEPPATAGTGAATSPQREPALTLALAPQSPRALSPTQRNRSTSVLPLPQTETQTPRQTQTQTQGLILPLPQTQTQTQTLTQSETQTQTETPREGQAQAQAQAQRPTVLEPGLQTPRQGQGQAQAQARATIREPSETPLTPLTPRPRQTLGATGTGSGLGSARAIAASIVEPGDGEWQGEAQGAWTPRLGWTPPSASASTSASAPASAQAAHGFAPAPVPLRGLAAAPTSALAPEHELELELGGPGLEREGWHTLASPLTLPVARQASRSSTSPHLGFRSGPGHGHASSARGLADAEDGPRQSPSPSRSATASRSRRSAGPGVTKDDAAAPVLFDGALTPLSDTSMPGSAPQKPLRPQEMEKLRRSARATTAAFKVNASKAAQSSPARARSASGLQRGPTAQAPLVGKVGLQRGAPAQTGRASARIPQGSNSRKEDPMRTGREVTRGQFPGPGGLADGRTSRSSSSQSTSTGAVGTGATGAGWPLSGAGGGSAGGIAGLGRGAAPRSRPPNLDTPSGRSWERLPGAAGRPEVSRPSTSARDIAAMCWLEFEDGLHDSS